MQGYNYKTPPTSSNPARSGVKPRSTPLSHFSEVDRVKLMRDLNSPSASNRVRALNAMKTPNKHKRYSMFDVAHEEEELVTEKERKDISEIKPKTVQDVFALAKVYVEVRSGDDDLTEGIKSVLRKLGATVTQTLVKTNTHVVFKEGLNSTYTKAKKFGIPIVSVLWIEASRKLLILADPTNYPISNKERYDNPELFKRVRRPKVMTPKINMDQPSRFSLISSVRNDEFVAAKVEDKTEEKGDVIVPDNNIQYNSAVIKTPTVQSTQTITTPKPTLMNEKINTNVTKSTEANIWKQALDNINRVVALSKNAKNMQTIAVDISGSKKLESESEKPKVVSTRRTLYTPEHYFQASLDTPKQSAKTIINRRRSLFNAEPSHVLTSSRKPVQRRQTLLSTKMSCSKLEPMNSFTTFPKLIRTKSTEVQLSKAKKRKFDDANTKENTPPRLKIKPFLTPSSNLFSKQPNVVAPKIALEMPLSKRRRTLFTAPEQEINR